MLGWNQKDEDIKERDDDSKEYNAHLREANEADLSILEKNECVSFGKDEFGNMVIVLIPKLGFRNEEKSDILLFRNTLLLFIRKANEIVDQPYSIVYAHTNIDLINQYPLIYKFYSLLPRAYKKNLQKMYIIHPTAAIKMFFEFAKVFLSKKFYQKLVLVESILDFQKLIHPTLVSLPMKFIRKEDDERKLKYHGFVAPLRDSFDEAIGTTRLIETCSLFIRSNGGLTRAGIFRIPGDESNLVLAKIRLQYLNRDGRHYSSMIALSKDLDNILIGDLDSVFPSTSKSFPQTIHNSLPKRQHSGSEIDNKSDNKNNSAPAILTSQSTNALLSITASPESTTTSTAPQDRRTPSLNGIFSTLSGRHYFYDNAPPEHYRDPQFVESVLNKSQSTPPPPPVSPPMRLSPAVSHNTLFRSESKVSYNSNALRQSRLMSTSAISFNSNRRAGSMRPSSMQLSPATLAAALSADLSPPLEVERNLSVICISDIDTVAQIFKLAIRELPEPLVPNHMYEQLLVLTRRHESVGFDDTWVEDSSTHLSRLPFENLATLIFVISFLREVARFSFFNSMDSSNLAIIFSACIFRADIDQTLDPMKALVEIKISQTIVRQLLDNHAILEEALYKKRGIRHLPVDEQSLASSEAALKAALLVTGVDDNASSISSMTLGHGRGVSKYHKKSGHHRHRHHSTASNASSIISQDSNLDMLVDESHSSSAYQSIRSIKSMASASLEPGIHQSLSSSQYMSNKTTGVPPPTPARPSGLRMKGDPPPDVTAAVNHIVKRVGSNPGMIATNEISSHPSPANRIPSDSQLSDTPTPDQIESNLTNTLFRSPAMMNRINGPSRTTSRANSMTLQASEEASVREGSTGNQASEALTPPMSPRKLHSVLSDELKTNSTGSERRFYAAHTVSPIVEELEDGESIREDQKRISLRLVHTSAESSHNENH